METQLTPDKIRAWLTYLRSLGLALPPPFLPVLPQELANLTPPQTQTQTQTTQTQKPQIELEFEPCRFCMALIPKGSKYCNHCGKEQKEPFKIA